MRVSLLLGLTPAEVRTIPYPDLIGILEMHTTLQQIQQHNEQKAMKQRKGRGR